MSDYEKTVKSLRICAKAERDYECAGCAYTGYNCNDLLKLDAAAAIEALQAKVADYEDTLKWHQKEFAELRAMIDDANARLEVGKAGNKFTLNATEQPHWVSVDEALPTCDGEYLVCVDVLGKSIYAARWFRAIRDNIPGESGWSGKFGVIKNKVTHWMPLPEPPQEVQE